MKYGFCVVLIFLVLIFVALAGVFTQLPADTNEIKSLTSGEIVVGSAKFSGYFSAREQAILIPATDLGGAIPQEGSNILFGGRSYKILGTKVQSGPWTNPEANDEGAYRLRMVKIYVE